MDPPFINELFWMFHGSWVRSKLFAMQTEGHPQRMNMRSRERDGARNESILANMTMKCWFGVNGNRPTRHGKVAKVGAGWPEPPLRGTLGLFKRANRHGFMPEATTTVPRSWKMVPWVPSCHPLKSAAVHDGRAKNDAANSPPPPWRLLLCSVTPVIRLIDRRYQSLSWFLEVNF